MGQLNGKSKMGFVPTTTYSKLTAGNRGLKNGVGIELGNVSQPTTILIFTFKILNFRGMFSNYHLNNR